ncbi:amidohydrolase [Arenicella xantha]|uniref:Amidohydrolase 3 domain-containing protein n=1 Tax=Arenicella xantha TaxID=644221 RepID=A0A395JQZ2_9GAMM|nr:amidohydrolase [Arenicella xantha]RBP52742.1 hypothetical protein DFR28_101124 [Arenicella xantha]
MNKYLIALSIAIFSIGAKAESKVTLVSNATVYTVDSEQPTADAFAYQNGKFIAVGKHADLRNAYPDAMPLDLDGATVVPGIIDAHGHLLGLGQSLMFADLMGTNNKAEIIALLQARAKDLVDGQWLLGRGWDQNDWPVKELPTAADLDAAFPDRPVWLERVDGHANWGNSKAMSFANKDLSGDWQPEGGEIVRNAKGQASGVFVDNAVALIQQQVPAATEAELTEALTLAMQKTASVGLTAMHDAGTSLQVWKLLESLNQQDKLTVRVYAMADGANEMLSYLCDNGASIDPAARLTARAVKLYSDGALGSRGAALLSDYSDDPSNMGLLIESEDTLKKHATRAEACGLQVNIHAIGDRGNRVTLNVLEASNTKDNPGRHRIEHSQIVEATDFKRFKELGLIASVQPTHATSDMYWAEDRVGPQRIQGAYAWQTFIEAGVPLALGSDFPVERAAPLPGFYAAVARQDAKGWPEKGWYADQALTREQALHGFTLGAAYAAFQEDQLGSIEVGKRADFVVLSKDIMQIPVAEILDTKILGTYIDGTAVFQAQP